jgi:tetratricopeptide (TPR) repeat protein
VTTRLARLAACVVAVLALAGCGDPALWARWQAERALFQVRAREHRLLARGAPDAAFDRIEARYREILEAWPPERWAASPGAGRDVAEAAAHAGLALAASAERRGHVAQAERDLASLEPRVVLLPEVLIAARRARRSALESLGRFDEARSERERIAATAFEPGDLDAATTVLDAALGLAAERREVGDGAGADAVLARTEHEFAAARDRASPAQREPMIEGLSQLRAARGDAAGALALLRERLLAAPEADRPLRLRTLASRALQAGAPDSAIAYARWAVRLSDARGVAGPAWLTEAAAFERLGRPDSALACYDHVLTHWHDPGTFGPVARFRRAELLDRMGRWELASAEYRALAAVYPAHPLALLTASRVVQHHLAHGQPELARLAGETGIDNLRHLQQVNRDPDVQRQAGAVEGDLLVALGRYDEAERALLDLWRRFPQDSTAEAGALRAAGLAQHRPGGSARADSVRQVLARAATDATVRNAARRESGVAPAR